MSDYTELKRLAEAVRDSDIDWEPNQKTYDYFQALRDPGVVLALIAETEELGRYLCTCRDGGLPCAKTRATADTSMGKGEKS